MEISTNSTQNEPESKNTAIIFLSNIESGTCSNFPTGILTFNLVQMIDLILQAWWSVCNNHVNYLFGGQTVQVIGHRAKKGLKREEFLSSDWGCCWVLERVKIPQSWQKHCDLGWSVSAKAKINPSSLWASRDCSLMRLGIMWWTLDRLWLKSGYAFKTLVLKIIFGYLFLNVHWWKISFLSNVG